MELNNKFGSCCNCPALMSDGRLFTSYISRKDYNQQLMKELNVTNSIEYKDALQSQASFLMEKSFNEAKNNFVCKSNDKNTFNKVIDINAYFDNELTKTLSQPSELFQ
jgi:hypothetical protein